MAFRAAHAVIGELASLHVSHSIRLCASFHEMRGGRPLQTQTTGLLVSLPASAAATSQGGLCGLRTSAFLAWAMAMKVSSAGASSTYAVGDLLRRAWIIFGGVTYVMF